MMIKIVKVLMRLINKIILICTMMKNKIKILKNQKKMIKFNLRNNLKIIQKKCKLCSKHKKYLLKIMNKKYYMKDIYEQQRKILNFLKIYIKIHSKFIQSITLNFLSI